MASLESDSLTFPQRLTPGWIFPMRWCDERLEVNFDGLVGLTHHYAGLSFGMKPLPVTVFRCLTRDWRRSRLTENESPCRCGIPPGRDPADERPFIPVLRQLGFSGSDEQYWKKLHARHRTGFPASAPLRNVGSQCGNDRAICRYAGWQMHLTVANLNNKFHRSLEAPVLNRC